MKVKSITEAFSMQPRTIEIKDAAYLQKYKLSGKEYAKEIKLETRQVDSEKACDFYVGYNFEGDEIFCYLRSSVNVHFDTE